MSTHFNKSEMLGKSDATKFTERVENNCNKLAEKLEILREYFGVPILVSSWFRDTKYNESLKNSNKLSKHLYGLAVDFHVKGINTRIAFEKIILHFPVLFDVVLYETTPEKGEWIHAQISSDENMNRHLFQLTFDEINFIQL